MQPTPMHLTKESMKRLARRAGVTRISNEVYPDIQSEVQQFVFDVVSEAVMSAYYYRKHRVTAVDIIMAISKKKKKNLDSL